MTMTKMTATTVFIAVFATALVPHLSAQTLFVAPISDFALGEDGPTRYEYIMNLGDRSECDTVVPVAREELADYTVWFEFEERHYALVWDGSGRLVGDRDNVRSSGNIVKDVCEIIRDHAAGARANGE